MMGYNHKCPQKLCIFIIMLHYSKTSVLFFKGTIASQVDNTTIDHQLAYVYMCVEIARLVKVNEVVRS